MSFHLASLFLHRPVLPSYKQLVRSTMRLYKQKDIPKQPRNSPDSSPRATSTSPDGRLPHRLKRAAEAVSKQIAGHKAMISQFNQSKPPRQPVKDKPLPLKRSNAVKAPAKPLVVPRKAEVSKAPSSVTSSKKQPAPSSPKSRFPPAPPGLGTKKAIPSHAKNVLNTLAAPRKPQSPTSQARSPVQKGAKPPSPRSQRSATPANLTSIPLISIPEQDEVDEPLLPAFCFRPLAKDDDEDSESEDWLNDDVELTSDFETQVTQVFSLGLGPQSKKDDDAKHGEIAPPLATPGTMLAQTLEPMSVLVENWHEPETNFASNSNRLETVPLHLTECEANDTPVIVPTLSILQSTSSPVFSVSPIVSSDLVLQKSLSCQPPSSKDYEFVSYLGQGAFGAVLLGIHKQNQRYCAIKIISKASVEEQDIVHTVLAEQHVMRQASDHPYLLGLLASFHDADNFYLISVSVHSPHLMTESSFPIFRNIASLRCSRFKCLRQTRGLRQQNWYFSSSLVR